MKAKTQFEQLMVDPEFRRLYAIEGLVTEAGEFIARLMQEQGVSKAELARRLGRSRAYVTQMLSGSANLTVRTLAEVAYALGAEVKLQAAPIGNAEREGVQTGSPAPVWKVVEPGRLRGRAARPAPSFRSSGGSHPDTATRFYYVA